MKRALIPALALLVVGCHKTAEEPSVTQAWVRLPAVPGQPGAAYFTMKGGRHDTRLVRIESALVSHHDITEAAVVGRPDDLTGQAIVALVTLKNGIQHSPGLKDALRAHVGKEIGPIAKPSDIRFVDGLPKTRSGKIMRRLLKEVAASPTGEIKGDTTTLEDLNVLAKLKTTEE